LDATAGSDEKLNPFLQVPKKIPYCLLSLPLSLSLSLLLSLGHVVEFCQDQHGSRFLQSQLESDSSSTEGPLILMEILDNLAAVKNDVFGNYVLQKVLERGSEEMKSQLWLALKGEVMELSLQMYG
jgi:hypothetical protein